MNEPENTFRFKSALIEQRGQSMWANNVAIRVESGKITQIETEAESGGGGGRDAMIEGVAIPAMVNVHSHAFQRGFAGLTEFRTADRDSFWTWRNKMYDFVQKLNPDDVYLIARQLYWEMLEAGYSWVGEFHYLHNSPTGEPYDNLAEMVDAVLRAADETGIGICLLPVLYQRSGFDSETANEGQVRFTLANEEFCRLVEICQSRIAELPNANLGIAMHSLRAVSQQSMGNVLATRRSQFANCPVHIHVAEQVQEIEDCLAATGQRSVEYLLANFEVDPNWCLIHATHMTDAEVAAVVGSGAVVGLCPTTEANLGDGFFPAKNFLSQGGGISIGSDSHCSVDLRDELRTLEYGQRLQTRQRAVLGTEQLSVGRRLYAGCAEGGGAAIGVPTGKIAVGMRADWLVVDDQHATIAGSSHDRLLDRLVFTNAGNPIRRRMIGGHWLDWHALAAQREAGSAAFYELSRRLI